ncbi:hypothetical protein [Chlorogloeopsis sp. ULAP02]|uniref:hypothetical protein n=1 Tax=Chlorogloeopsis sp. ULAP02 TaxID=3107926 RepID=UPI00313713FB
MYLCDRASCDSIIIRLANLPWAGSNLRSPQPTNRNRDVTINIRVHQAQRNLIDSAAGALGKSRSIL